jgi:malate dehydrogenase (oxaloacetate-decarboxylating)
MEDLNKESLELHEKYHGKLEVRSKIPLRDKKDLSMVYTPGVAEVCRAIQKDKRNAYRYTIKSNTVAIITDGSAVLGLGNIGGYAAIPVMEGKAMLFKEFAGIDAFPICFEGYHVDFVADVKNMAPVFGAICLEDVAAPKCFMLEHLLQDIDIPVMHDDQHGTAVVAMAALLNASKVVGKTFEELKVVINGAGAAGNAIARLLDCSGMDTYCPRPREIIVCDRKGTIYEGRKDLPENRWKEALAVETNLSNMRGTLKDAMVGADVFIGVSAPDLVTEEMVASMNEDAIVLALANPVPEIMPDKAKRAGARIVATGRSDFPNQVNNVLAFPGLFRGALDASATSITDEMKNAAVLALAGHLKKPSQERILPDVLDRKVAYVIGKAVQEAAPEQ